MDRNSIIGLVLIAGILVLFSIYNAPSEEELKAMEAKRDSIAKVEQAKDTARKITVEDVIAKDSMPQTVLLSGDSNLVSSDSMNLDSIRAVIAEQDLKNKYGLFSISAEGESKYYTIENEKIKVTFNSKGGRIAFVEIKNYKNYSDYAGGKDSYLKLFDEDSSAQAVTFFLDNKTISTGNFYFTSASPLKQEVKDKALSLTFRLKTSDDKKYIEFVYTLEPDSYVLNYDVVVNELAAENVASSMSLNWQMKMLSTEKTRDQETVVSSIFYQYEGKSRTYLSEMESEKLALEAKTSWIAFKQSYFSAIIMSEKGFDNDGSDIEIVTLGSSSKYIKEYIANVNIGADNAKKVTVPMQFYFGPNDYNELAKFDNGMEGIVNLGWGIFGWVNKYLVIPVFKFLEGFGMNYGLIILLLTIIVKIIILPLTYRNLKSSAKMRVLKPDVDEINKRLADEPMKKQQEVMGLYRKSGVNPLAGCIPLLIQMPVLIAVFRFFPSAIELRQESFLWAEDLSAYDSILQLGFSIPFYGDHVSLFTLLMCVSTILITSMNSGQMDTSMPGMKFMMYFFPVMMLFFFNQYSSGLTYYYFISNLLSMGLMWGIKKYAIDEKKLLAQIHENRKKPVSAKKSAFMQRLEEAQRKQQQKKKK